MDFITKYLKEIEKAVERGDATEHTHRIHLQQLVESFAQSIQSGKHQFIITNEPKRIDCGAPDLSVSRAGQPIGYIEAKDIGKSLDEAEKSEQLKRYFPLGNIILTDYIEFRWYIDGAPKLEAKLGYLIGDRKIKPLADYFEKVQSLFHGFLTHEPKPINKPKELAISMARITHMIRDIIIDAFNNGKASDLLIDLRRAFTDILIPDLDKPEKTEEFADMYAQTIAYGLFAARFNHRGKIGSFKRLGAAAEIPKTNPLLRKLFTHITGPELDDEPYAGFVDDLVALLSFTYIENVLSHFGERNKKEDPVVHFYETFLAEYDPKLREARGVYYTPEPVVSYIVRSVDYLLKSRFKCKDGLADASRTSYLRDDPEVGQIYDESHKVLILDPACGTGTFLYSVVDHIRDQFMNKKNAGMWSGYVTKNLLPRIFGFELLMAPYAVAHFKLAMQLAGYDIPELYRKQWVHDFESGERLNIFLTNTLEKVDKKALEKIMIMRYLFAEADEAAKIKAQKPIMVIIGNPPYAVNSYNKGEWCTDLVRQSYYPHDEIKEQNPKLLLDDYVKFIRWAQWRIEKTGSGILAFITNHSYLDNPTFRAMRKNLMDVFDEIYIMDLHGNTKKKEKAPDGSKDSNVFDIQQGVAIGIFVKTGKKKSKIKLSHSELWGSREKKYQQLQNSDITSSKWKKLNPTAPFYFFIPKRGAHLDEYKRGWKINDIFITTSTGIKTHRDHFVLDFDKEALKRRIRDFTNLRIEDYIIRQKYDLLDTRDWKLKERRISLGKYKNWENYMRLSLYRPFDLRNILYHRDALELPRGEVMRHMMLGKNMGIAAGRQGQVVGKITWDLILASKEITDVNLFYRGGIQFFPLYLYPDPATNGDLFSNGCARHVNLNSRFTSEFSGKLDLTFIHEGQGDIAKISTRPKRKATYAKKERLPQTFGPEDLFYYIYALFHSPVYRERYAEFLKIDFPRVPLTAKHDLFRELIFLGHQLVGLHLMESFGPDMSGFPLKGENIVEQVRYTEPGQGAEKGRVFINKEQYFEGVPPEVWGFHIGGYQVCHKWLKDRKGRVLSYEDREHYQNIVSAISETIRLMKEIDATIDKHGGWPIK